MNDSVAPQLPTGLSAGTLLREAREAAGLHIAALAVSLKVPVKKLEALEADQFDQLPDAVFVRALAASVCRTLKLDPATVLERLPQTSAPRLIHDDNGINAPFRAPSDAAGPSWMDQLSKPVFLAVLVLLLGALALIFLPSIQRDEGGVSSATKMESMPPPIQVLPPEPPAAAAPVPAPVFAPASAPIASTALIATVQAPQPTAASVAKSATDVAAGAVSVKSVASAAAAPLMATGAVVFRAKGESWVEVIDARGVVTLRKLLGNGETIGVNGNLPLTVVVGRADATEVHVKGKPFDLGAVSRDNVARFEVK